MTKSLVLALTVAVLAVPIAADARPTPPVLTVDDIIAHPDAYDGRKVRVRGYWYFGGLVSDDPSNAGQCVIGSRRLIVERRGSYIEAKWTGRHVVMEGVFHDRPVPMDYPFLDPHQPDLIGPLVNAKLIEKSGAYCEGPYSNRPAP